MCGYQSVFLQSYFRPLELDWTVLWKECNPRFLMRNFLLIISLLTSKFELVPEVSTVENNPLYYPLLTVHVLSLVRPIYKRKYLVAIFSGYAMLLSLIRIL
jgi:hypothetical protein